MNRKPLYLALSLDDLQRIAIEKIGALLTRNNFQTLISLERKMFGLLTEQDFDEELAFIYCIRHQRIIEAMKTIDKKFVEFRYTKEVAYVKDRLKLLVESLCERYSDLLAVEHVPDDDERSDLNNRPLCLFMNAYISSKELYDAITVFEDLLILDIRPEDQFVLNRIKYNNIINIPPNKIENGLSANKLGDQLPLSTREMWGRRDQFRAIIIVDYMIRDPNSEEEKFAILRSIMVNWDPNRNYRQKPVVLEDGYKEFVERYPTFVVNGHIQIRFKYTEFDELMVETRAVDVPKTTLDSESAISLLSNDDITLASLSTVSMALSTFSKDSLEVQDNKSQPHASSSEDSLSSTATEKPMDQDDDTLVDEQEERIKKMAKSLSEDVKELRKIKPRLPPAVNRDIKPIIRLNNEMRRNAKMGLVGLVNCLNNCYMNSTLQAFRCLPIIKAFIMSNLARRLRDTNKCVLLDEVHKKVQALWTSVSCLSKSYCEEFRTRMIQFNPNYKLGQHEDAMEFFLLFLEKLEHDTVCPYREIEGSLKIHIFNAKGGIWSYITDFFYCVIMNVKICNNCGARSISYDVENTIMISVFEEVRTLYDLLDIYFQDTILDNYKCDSCKRVVTLTIQKSLEVAPRVLVVHVKRMRTTMTGETIKTHARIPFPDNTMNIFDWKYSLYSAICHTGSLNAGHYYTVAKIYDKWYQFSDMTVTPRYLIEKELQLETCAFFFQRIEEDELNKKKCD